MGDTASVMPFMRSGERERILVVDDDRAFRLATQTLLGDNDYRVSLAVNAPEALALLEKEEFDLMLTDMVMEKMTGVELLKKIKTRLPDLLVIMVTGFGSISTAVEAMYHGAADYLTKPCNNDELLLKIRKALDSQQKDRELKLLREELRSTVLIQGESGTGKELVAHALHYNSNRKSGPFVVVNCSAIPENLLESELFGYEKGAFTGAAKQKPGRFEDAHSGTLFLDEIGDISPAIQTKLLRVLQEKKFERVGGNTPLSVDTRVVAATNRDLEAMTRQGDFREDLYYRLNVFPIHLPPLRDRLEDIPLLAEHFLQRHADLSGARVKFIAPGVIGDMMNYAWRGNIRELENLMKRAIIKTQGDTVTNMELPVVEPRTAQHTSEPSPNLNTPFKDYLSTITRDAEEKYLLRMLRLYKGNINHIAKLMDVDRKTIYRKMAEYSLDPSTFRG